jgi:hypothetical protein
MIQVPFRVFRNSYSPLSRSFRSLWSQINFVVEVITIGDGLPDFLGTSCSGRVFSVPAVSMVMSLVLTGAKKLRVGPAFGVCLTDVDIGTDLLDYMFVSEISLEIHVMRLFTFWKSSLWTVDSNEVLFTAPLCRV